MKLTKISFNVLKSKLLEGGRLNLPSGWTQLRWNSTLTSVWLRVISYELLFSFLFFRQRLFCLCIVPHFHNSFFSCFLHFPVLPLPKFCWENAHSRSFLLHPYGLYHFLPCTSFVPVTPLFVPHFPSQNPVEHAPSRVLPSLYLSLPYLPVLLILRPLLIYWGFPENCIFDWRFGFFFIWFLFVQCCRFCFQFVASAVSVCIFDCNAFFFPFSGIFLITLYLTTFLFVPCIYCISCVCYIFVLILI